MDENKSLNESIQELSKRIEALEIIVGTKKSSPPPAPISIPPEVPKEFTRRIESSSSLGTWMASLAAICIVGAFILLIKLSIDSGWLTPIRQIMISCMLGGLLTLSPRITFLSDKAYLSIMPAIGIIVLHLAIYGGVFFHKIFDAPSALLAVSVVGCYSLYLLSTYKEDYYAIFGIVGTYIGAMVLNSAFLNLYYFAAYLLTWNIVFSIYSIKLKNRFYLVLAAYLSLFFVTISSFNKSNIDYFQLALLQFLQILIYSCFVARHSIVTKLKLTESETYSLFPIYLFFYATEFYFLDKLNPHYATGFAVIFSAILLGLTFYAKKQLAGEKLHSLKGIYTLVALMLYHSLFLLLLSPTLQFIVGIPLALAVGYILTKKHNEDLAGVTFISGLVLAYLLLSLSFNTHMVPNVFIFNALYGVLFVAVIVSSALKNNYKELCILVAHSQIVLAIFRMSGDILNSFTSSLVLILYAFFILGVAVKKQDRILAKSSFPVIVIGFLKGVIGNMYLFNTVYSIAGLALIGFLIYLCGYLYRKIPSESEL